MDFVWYFKAMKSSPYLIMISSIKCSMVKWIIIFVTSGDFLEVSFDKNVLSERNLKILTNVPPSG